MSEQKPTMYQDQKKTKPMVEDVIAAQLQGENREKALEFVAYLRENKMPPTWGSANSWKASFKNKGVCYIKLDQEGRNVWKVNPHTDYTEEYKAFAQREGLIEIIWRNPAYCTRCHPNTCAPKGGADTFLGVEKTYFGKTIGGICRGGDTSFVNPDEEAVGCLKKMLAFRQRSILDGTTKKVKYVAQKRRISLTELITLEKEISIVGLSLSKTELPQDAKGLGAMWGLYTDAHRIRTKNVMTPVVEYGVSVIKAHSYDYIVGSGVSEFGRVDADLTALSIPAGKYIKDTFNAFDFEDLVESALPGREPHVKKWAEDNGVRIASPSLFIEVYPVQEMAGNQDGATSETFKRDSRLAAEYPVMYTLTPVESY